MRWYIRHLSSMILIDGVLCVCGCACMCVGVRVLYKAGSSTVFFLPVHKCPECGRG